jgi:hypothetical protein
MMKSPDNVDASDFAYRRVTSDETKIELGCRCSDKAITTFWDFVERLGSANDGDRQINGMEASR